MSIPLLTGRSWAAVGLSMRACVASSGGRLVTPLSSGYCCGCCCDASLACFAAVGSCSCCLCGERSTTTLCFRIE